SPALCRIELSRSGVSRQDGPFQARSPDAAGFPDDGLHQRLTNAAAARALGDVQLLHHQGWLKVISPRDAIVHRHTEESMARLGGDEGSEPRRPLQAV